MVKSATTPTRATTRKDPLMHAPGRRLLEAIGRYHYLTSRQVSRLLGWETFHQYSQLWLKKLTDAGYLTMANWIEKGPSAGGAERVWSLTTRGYTTLRDLGIQPGIRIHHSPGRAQIFMLHTQAIGDTLIAVDRYAQTTPNVHLVEFLHDQDLSRRAVKVQVPNAEKPTYVNQDGFTVLQLGVPKAAIGWEIDRATEKRDKWQAKVAALVAFASGPYQEAFGFKSLRVAVYIRPHEVKITPDKRLTQLMTWTEESLTASNQRQWGEFFAFTVVDPAQVEPVCFLRGLHWVSPFVREYKPLIPEATA
jgi:hypothetical protein